MAGCGHHSRAVPGRAKGAAVKLIKVEVLENATIFDAGEQIHRFDLPSSGILAGWAVAAVVDQVKVIADADWPDIEVAVRGPDRAVEVLTRTLLNKGIVAYDEEEVKQDVGKPAQSALPLSLPRRPTRGQRKTALPAPNVFQVAIIAVIGLVLVLSWRGLESAPQAASTAKPVTTSAVPLTSSEPGKSVVVEYDRVRVQLPAGFTLAPREDGLLVATGKDPELRILVAVDPVYGVDAGAIRTEIAAMVADDPLLAEQPNRNLRPAEPTVEYLEEPGDGSSVHWVAWVAKDHQFSIGCHTKTATSLSHRAACRMAVETLDFS